MKRLISLLVSVCLVLTGCTNSNTLTSQSTEPISYQYPREFENASDPDLVPSLEESVYEVLIDKLDSTEYLIEEVEVAHISQEYLDELAFNSQENIFFGYSLTDVVNYFGSTPYVFTSENGATIVKKFEDYDDTWDEVAKNISTGTGVILVCVTITAVASAAGAPATFTTILTTATSSAIRSAAISAAVSGVVSGVITGFETSDIDSALKSAALSASEDYKWGAILGAVAGGGTKSIGLLHASRNGLTVSEAAIIQKESRYPLSIIKDMRNMEEYEVYKNAGLKPCTIKTAQGKRTVLARDLDMNLVDENGLTNLERMKNGLNPLDEDGVPFEYHHVGQKNDGALAILSRKEHDSHGLHINQESEIERQTFNKERIQINSEIAELYLPAA
jgi:hypothetical protein